MVFRRSTYAFSLYLALPLAALLCFPTALRAQNASQPKALDVLRTAVHTELEAAKSDHTLWMYHDHDVTAGKNAMYYAVETPKGTVRRMIELNGHPLDAQAREAETQRIATFVSSPSAQAKQRKSGAHDDAQAASMLKMLPQAFIWKIVSDSPDYVTLSFEPDPNFDAPSMQSRVMSKMGGEMTITHPGNRIRSLRGKLTQEVKFGWGILGELNQGGTFDVERRKVDAAHWEIVTTNVHIGGRALLFKDIGQQEDETKSDWKPSTAHTLKEAEDILNNVH